MAIGLAAVVFAGCGSSNNDVAYALLGSSSTTATPAKVLVVQGPMQPRVERALYVPGSGPPPSTLDGLLSPDGRLVALVSAGLAIMDATTGTTRGWFSHCARAARFAPDSRHVVVLGCSDEPVTDASRLPDVSVYLWDLSSDRVETLATGPFQGAEFVREGTRVGLYSPTEVLVTDLAGIVKWRVSARGHGSVRFARDGDRYVRSEDVGTSASATTLHRDNDTSVVFREAEPRGFSDDMRLVARGSFSGELVISDVDSGAELLRHKCAGDNVCEASGFSPDNRLVAVASSGAADREPTHAELLNLTGAEKGRSVTMNVGWPAWSRDGARVAIGSERGVTIFDVARPADATTYPVTDISAWSADLRTALAWPHPRNKPPSVVVIDQGELQAHPLPITIDEEQSPLFPVTAPKPGLPESVLIGAETLPIRFPEGVGDIRLERGDKTRLLEKSSIAWGRARDLERFGTSPTGLFLWGSGVSAGPDEESAERRLVVWATRTGKKIVDVVVGTKKSAKLDQSQLVEFSPSEDRVLIEVTDTSGKRSSRALDLYSLPDGKKLASLPKRRRPLSWSPSGRWFAMERTVIEVSTGAVAWTGDPVDFWVSDELVVTRPEVLGGSSPALTAREAATGVEVGSLSGARIFVERAGDLVLLTDGRGVYQLWSARTLEYFGKLPPAVRAQFHSGPSFVELDSVRGKTFYRVADGALLHRVSTPEGAVWFTDAGDFDGSAGAIARLKVRIGSNIAEGEIVDRDAWPPGSRARPLEADFFAGK
ncbi:MAG: hypothetical protein U0271_27240 [Polyangiaceae bacterium]